MNMEKSKNTVSRELYRILKEDGGFVPSGHLESLHVLGATGSTISRKLRALCEAGYVEVKYEGEKHHAFYRAKTKKSDVAHTDASVSSKTAPTDVPKPKVTYVPVYENGNPRPVAMRKVVETL